MHYSVRWMIFYQNLEIFCGQIGRLILVLTCGKFKTIHSQQLKDPYF